MEYLADGHCLKNNFPTNFEDMSCFFSLFFRMKQYQYDNVEGADQPDLILEMLARLSQSILRENDLEK